VRSNQPAELSAPVGQCLLAVLPGSSAWSAAPAHPWQLPVQLRLVLLVSR
jgi:hypothetical protein